MTDTYSVTSWRQMFGLGDWPRFWGVACYQFQSDMDRYGQLIDELKPPFIIEVGRAEGGCALFLAERLWHANPNGAVVSIDIAPPQHGHSRLRMVTGRSTDPDTTAYCYAVAGDRRGLVLLDGDHASVTVAQELELYAPLADYLIVEDTIMRNLPELGGDGPHVALDAWLPNHPEFVADPDPIPTQHPGGYLRRTT
jgi:cephalosporin hydroxylase